MIKNPKLEKTQNIPKPKTPGPVFFKYFVKT